MNHFWRDAFARVSAAAALVGTVVAGSVIGVLVTEAETGLGGILIQAVGAGVCSFVLFSAIIASVNTLHLMRNLARFGLSSADASLSVRSTRTLTMPLVHGLREHRIVESSLRNLGQLNRVSLETKHADDGKASAVCAGLKGGNVLLELAISRGVDCYEVSIEVRPENSWKRLNGGASWTASELAASAVLRSAGE
ncbi:hypothetical protein ACIRQY_22605 [Streptomyces sp. NPDC101490]|uniref:hypothetical protein n=1 Tax=Streptomyces sp. NPDC101490 TaxID=3366143 RepID=UPI003805D144